MPNQAEIIVALDVQTSQEVDGIVRQLGNSVSFYKVGLELFTAIGPDVLVILKNHGKRVFLDLKLHDIPRTVARSVKSCAKHGVDLLTVHAAGGYEMLRAASQSREELGSGSPRIVAVTTLTSLDQKGLEDIGVTRPLSDYTMFLGQMAISCGVDGLVCSVWEAPDFRREFADILLVTPGIRPAGREAGDQKRVATPSAAVRAGASFLVIGRPILEADDPAAAARAIAVEMSAC
jgi:orotidine-5'-phosphate decarboxylase